MLSVLPQDLHSQGIARANGFGVRLSYWNLGSGPARVDATSENAAFEINGAGGWLNFYTRLSNKWLFDLSFGMVTRVRGHDSNFGGTEVDISALIPLLFGTRYQFLPARSDSRVQPYLAAGLGPHWSTNLSVTNQVTNEQISGQGKAHFGGYLGAGMNLDLQSWLALTFDLKYHFVDIDLNHGLSKISYGEEFSGMEFGAGLAFQWGRKRELFRLKDVKVIVTDLYPTYYQFYNSYPLALVTVENTAGYPIEINTQSYIRGFSERPQDSPFVRLNKGEKRDLPVTAIFGTKLQRASERLPAVLDIKIEARGGTRTTKEISAPLTVHHRNAWNGDMDKLVLFVTPEEEQVLRFGRTLAARSPQNGSALPSNFAIARAVFDSLTALHLRYQSDPNVPFYRDDRVQFAAETLALRTGDCDDLVVLSSSILESLGIKTAFVEVQDPEREIAHLYMMFDAGIAAENAERISSNSKRYVLRANAIGVPFVWIPVETTLIAQGFEDSWNAGARAYLEDGVYRGGLADGWVKIIEVN